MKKLDVIATGRAGVDLYGAQIGGRLEDMGSFDKHIGGSPPNMACGTARPGLRSGLITRVGDEHMGASVDAPKDELAARQPPVKDFAVGRTFFGDAARDWMAGRIEDRETVDPMQTNYARLCHVWDEAHAETKEEVA